MFSAVISLTSLYPLLEFGRGASNYEPNSNASVEVYYAGDQHDHRYSFVIKEGRGDASQEWQTSTIICPDAVSILADAEKLEVPKVDVPLYPDVDIVITADGIGYSLRSRASYPDKAMGTIVISTNVGTPLADFVENSLSILRGCPKTKSPDSK